jgi:hypothetical protein
MFLAGKVYAFHISTMMTTDVIVWLSVRNALFLDTKNKRQEMSAER